VYEKKKEEENSSYIFHSKFKQKKLDIFCVFKTREFQKMSGIGSK
jgi:hypothetical protein